MEFNKDFIIDNSYKTKAEQDGQWHVFLCNTIKNYVHLLRIFPSLERKRFCETSIFLWLDGLNEKLSIL